MQTSGGSFILGSISFPSYKSLHKHIKLDSFIAFFLLCFQIVQGFGIKPLTSRMSEIGVIRVGAAVLVLAYLGLVSYSEKTSVTLYRNKNQ